VTFAVGHVEGGTGAGRRRPLREKPAPWRCECGNPDGRGSRYKTQPGYLARCLDCGARRP